MRLSRRISPDKLVKYIKRCAIKFHIFWYQWRHRGRQGKKGFEWKTDRKLKITGVEIAWVEMKSNKYPPHFIYENDQRNKINIFGDFENVTPTHLGATHTFSKNDGKFQNRTPRESDQNFDISGISVIHWISSKFFK